MAHAGARSAAVVWCYASACGRRRSTPPCAAASFSLPIPRHPATHRVIQCRPLPCSVRSTSASRSSLGGSASTTMSLQRARKRVGWSVQGAGHCRLAGPMPVLSGLRLPKPPPPPPPHLLACPACGCRRARRMPSVAAAAARGGSSCRPAVLFAHGGSEVGARMSALGDQAAAVTMRSPPPTRTWSVRARGMLPCRTALSCRQWGGWRGCAQRQAALLTRWCGACLPTPAAVALKTAASHYASTCAAAPCFSPPPKPHQSLHEWQADKHQPHMAKSMRSGPLPSPPLPSTPRPQWRRSPAAKAKTCSRKAKFMSTVAGKLVSSVTRAPGVLTRTQYIL